jgi:hypothetical protein
LVAHRPWLGLDDPVEEEHGQVQSWSVDVVLTAELSHPVDNSHSLSQVDEGLSGSHLVIGVVGDRGDQGINGETRILNKF